MESQYLTFKVIVEPKDLERLENIKKDLEGNKEIAQLVLKPMYSFTYLEFLQLIFDINLITKKNDRNYVVFNLYDLKKLSVNILKVENAIVISNTTETLKLWSALQKASAEVLSLLDDLLSPF
jgi:hypothetical protein